LDDQYFNKKVYNSQWLKWLRLNLAIKNFRREMLQKVF